MVLLNMMYNGKLKAHIVLQSEWYVGDVF